MPVLLFDGQIPPSQYAQMLLQSVDTMQRKLSKVGISGVSLNAL